MTIKELIELLQQLPLDAEMCLGQYNGESSLCNDDFVVYYEHQPMRIIIPDYEWRGASQEAYMRLDEYLKEHINKD